MNDLGFPLALLTLAIALVACAVYAFRQTMRAQALAAAWRYLQWDDKTLAKLRADLAARAVGRSLRVGSSSLRAVDDAIAMKHEFARRIAGTRSDFHTAGEMEVRLLALDMNGMHYTLVPICIGRLDLEALHRSGRLSCVSDPVRGQTAFAAVMTRETLRHFMLPENDPWFAPTFRWYSALPTSVAFVLAHLVPAERLSAEH
ncbi:hypothetical protein [Niveibacterium sp.]|uniref:hypothetical protein n=1 Tax=Niveibacterium sp. TaxID=2017444 RepID=UPI0035B47E9B